MKPLVIYHASCADGFGAAFAAWLKLGDDAEYVPMQYGKLPDDESWEAMTTDSEVYILDFSLEKGMMNVAFARAKRVVWLDHHASVFKDWNIPLSVVGDNAYFSIEDTSHYVRLDNSKSGAYLAWEYFHPGTEVPLFIRHIDDYDRWVFALEGTKAFQKALWSYAPWSFAQWQSFITRWERQPLFGEPVYPTEYFSEFLNEGRAILRAHEQNVQSVVKGAVRRCEISFNEEAALDCVEPRLEWNNGGYWMVHGLAANCPPHLTSDVGHELATQSGTFGLLWHVDKDGQCRCSLRSNGDYDVSAIAKAFGGGGHLNASGFTTDIQTLLGWLK